MKKLNYKELQVNIDNLVNTYKLSNINEDLVIEVDTDCNIIEVVDDQISVGREFILNQGVVLNYFKIGFSTLNSNIEIKNTLLENANMNIFLLDFANANNLIYSELKNKESSLNIYSLIDLEKDVQVDTKVKTIHLLNNTYSNLIFKQLLDDSSLAKIDLKSIVQKGAKNSKAFQDSKTILLSENSSVFVTPHLEILVDELEAKHGATSGELDGDAIYYLQSRGLDKQSAKNLLIDAFKESIYSNIEDDDLKEYIKELVGGYYV